MASPEHSGSVALKETTLVHRFYICCKKTNKHEIKVHIYIFYIYDSIVIISPDIYVYVYYKFFLQNNTNQSINQSINLYQLFSLTEVRFMVCVALFFLTDELYA
jgi:hypothetical protein